jgi:hypothetical protein
MPSSLSAALRSAENLRTIGRLAGREPHFKVAHPLKISIGK